MQLTALSLFACNTFMLKEDHHLKHAGKMQLGLFLKGVGLKLEDALAFWGAGFSQKVGVERFEKEDAYNVRQYYGKEGKRTIILLILIKELFRLPLKLGITTGAPSDISEEGVHSRIILLILVKELFRLPLELGITTGAPSDISVRRT